jgi:hypothetical protein
MKINAAMIIKIKKDKGLKGWRCNTHDCMKIFQISQMETFRLTELPAVSLSERILFPNL